MRLGERRTIAQLSAFDFAVAVAIGAIIGRGATASDTSFATSAVALVTFLVAHRVVAIGRRHSRVVRLIDHPPRVPVARGELQAGELSRTGLTAADVYALLRQHGVGDLGQVGYLLYETRGTVTVIGADREPDPLERDGLNASGYRRAPQVRPDQRLPTVNTRGTGRARPDADSCRAARTVTRAGPTIFCGGGSCSRRPRPVVRGEEKPRPVRHKSFRPNERWFIAPGTWLRSPGPAI